MHPPSSEPHAALAPSPADPLGPWNPPPRGVDADPSPPGLPHRRRTRLASIAVGLLLVAGFGAMAYRDLSRPEAWAYWKDLYLSPGMMSSLVPDAFTDATGRHRPALVVSGRIGPAAAGWFRDRIDEAHLVPGDAVFLSSPGGDLNQGLIIGAIIRSRGLVTAVGLFDPAGHRAPSYCASACVFAYAGGATRLGVRGSKLGVHRFTAAGSGDDPVAETQRIAGRVLGYMTRMGVSSSIVEAMAATDEIHWLSTKEARDLKLVTEPADRT